MTYRFPRLTLNMKQDKAVNLPSDSQVSSRAVGLYAKGYIVLRFCNTSWRALKPSRYHFLRVNVL